MTPDDVTAALQAALELKPSEDVPGARWWAEMAVYYRAEASAWRQLEPYAARHWHELALRAVAAAADAASEKARRFAHEAELGGIALPEQ